MSSLQCPLRSFSFIPRIVCSALAVALSLFVAGCNGSVDVPNNIEIHDLDDTRGQLRAQYAQRLSEVLVINKNSETRVTGEVTHTRMGCDSGEESCHLILSFDDLTVNIYYRYSPGGSCVNTKAVEVAEQLSNGDTVTVFGKYYALGSISTCDSPTYFIHKER